MISENKRRTLEIQMKSLGILEADIDEHFIRSGGNGGQNVNKVSTCVYIKHRPSGIEVKCQQTRSQVDNRYLARRILCDKIEARVLGKKSAIAQATFKKRKQKAKRTKRSKEKMLSDKKHRGAVKSSRNRPSTEG